MEQRENFEEKSNWTDKDWKWLIGILIGVIILILSLWFAGKKGIEANFAIMSSAVSIALGLIAIYIALKQDSDSQRLNQQMQMTLKAMENKIDKVDQKVNKLDGLDVEKSIEENLNPIIERLTTTLQEKSADISKRDIQQVFEETVPYVAKSVSVELNERMNTDKNARELIYYQQKKLENTIMKILKNNPDGLTYKEIQDIVLKRYSNYHSENAILNCLDFLLENGEAQRVGKRDNLNLYGVSRQRYSNTKQYV
ncbi:hypothetical protein RE433_18125 [Bacillus cereus]|uniref:hypothetical protein n=1 Tax=Bacillus cereus TaxID=1396 RepID=UPI0002793279|nr:hypothetical protein [Bacillus cereus]EJQ19504.1 hypothetical protein IE5_03502 [Bacillus cereus BAG3X2-2]WMW36795.1 hypothetical protein RE433_18125 [Bacillus cereus]